MSLFLSFYKFSTESTRGFIDQGPVAREAQIRSNAEARGGKLLGWYLAEGSEWNTVVITEMPDGLPEGTAQAIALKAQASGVFSEVRTIRLCTAQQAQDALDAWSVGPQLVPPGTN